MAVHPNSLAALTPYAYKPGQAPVHVSTGPIITPALRRFANMDPRAFFHVNLDKATMGEVVAWTMLWRATQEDGDKDRERVMNRLDGMQRGADVNVNVESGAKLALFWNASDGA